MMRREEIAREIWNRLSAVSGVVRVARNPEKPPNVEDLSTLQFFELDDRVLEARMTDTAPAYKRRLTVVIEAFVAGESEALATSNLMAFVKLMKKSIYNGSNTLKTGRKVLGEIVEVDQSRVLRPGVGSHVAGIGTVFHIQYTEDTKDY